MTAASPDTAVKNGHQVSSYDTGMCQKFVRDQCWRAPSLYGSAIEAWNGARDKHPGDRSPPEGAPCYYRGGQYGHAVIFCHGGIRSTDCTSGGRVSDTDLGWPERTWGYEYLGWTGDINGVDLPLDTAGNGGDGSDDVPEYLHMKLSGADLPSEQWKILEWDDVVADSTGKAGVAGEPGIRIGGCRYTATLLAAVDVSGERVLSRTTEAAPDGKGNFELAETNDTLEHLCTSGNTYIQDTRTGSVGKDRRLRFELSLPAKGTVLSADLTVLFW